MRFQDALQEAAHRADAAVHSAMNKYTSGHVHGEDGITGILIGQLDSRLQGQIGKLTWQMSVVRHRKGEAAEEKRIGANFIIHVQLKTK